MGSFCGPNLEETHVFTYSMLLTWILKTKHESLPFLVLFERLKIRD